MCDDPRQAALCWQLGLGFVYCVTLGSRVPLCALLEPVSCV